MDELTRRHFLAVAGVAGTAAAAAAGAAAAGAEMTPFALGESDPVAEGPAVPEPRNNAIILFQGDSITDNNRDRKSSDVNHPAALGSGYPLLAASAALAQHPTRKFRFYNRGISGNRVPDLDARWQRDTLDIKPDIISILIGVNDFWHTLSKGATGTTASYEASYLSLLERTRRLLPDADIVVVEPFILRTGFVDAKWYPAFAERQAATAGVAKRMKARFVRTQSMFDKLAARTGPEYWAADGIHPTLAGHQVIAERWRIGAGI